jgi:hypothetical protein
MNHVTFFDDNLQTTSCISNVGVSFLIKANRVVGGTTGNALVNNEDA